MDDISKRELLNPTNTFGSGWLTLCGFGYSTFRRGWSGTDKFLSRVNRQIFIKGKLISFVPEVFIKSLLLYASLLTDAHRALSKGEKSRFGGINKKKKILYHRQSRMCNHLIFLLFLPLFPFWKNISRFQMAKGLTLTSMVSEWMVVAWCTLPSDLVTS